MQSGAGNGANQIAAVLHSNIFTRDYVDVGSCRVALKSVLPQFVWRNYPELGTFGRDSRDFKKALVARERSFGSRR